MGSKMTPFRDLGRSLPTSNDFSILRRFVLTAVEILAELNWWICRIFLSTELADAQLNFVRVIVRYFRNTGSKSIQNFFGELFKASTATSNLLSAIVKWSSQVLFRLLVFVIGSTIVVFLWRRLSRHRRKLKASRKEVAILHSRAPYLGGAERCLLGIAEAFRTQGYNVTIYTRDDAVVEAMIHAQGYSTSTGIAVASLSSGWFVRSPVASRIVEIMLDFLLGMNLAATINHSQILIDTYGTHWATWASFGTLTDCPVSAYVHFAPISRSESDLVSGSIAPLLIRLRLFAAAQHLAKTFYLLLLEFFYTWCAEFAKGGIVVNSDVTRRRIDRLSWTSAYYGSVHVASPPVSVSRFIAIPPERVLDIAVPLSSPWDLYADANFAKEVIERPFSNVLLNVCSLKPFKRPHLLTEAYRSLPPDDIDKYSLEFCCLCSENPCWEEASLLSKILVMPSIEGIRVRVESSDKSVLRQLASMIRSTLVFYDVGDKAWTTKGDKDRKGMIRIRINASEGEVVDAYRRADVYVHLMEDEHYGIAPAQALVAGLEILSVDNGNPGESLFQPYSGRNWIAGRLGPSKTVLENFKSTIESDVATSKSSPTSNDPLPDGYRKLGPSTAENPTTRGNAEGLVDPNTVAYFFSEDEMSQHDTLDVVLRRWALDTNVHSRRLMRTNSLLAAMARVSDAPRFRQNAVELLTKGGERLTIKDV